MLKYLDRPISANEHVSSETTPSGHLFLLFFFSTSSTRRIDCKHNGLEACPLSPAHLMGHDVPVLVYVELKEANAGTD